MKDDGLIWSKKFWGRKKTERWIDTLIHLEYSKSTQRTKVIEVNDREHLLVLKQREELFKFKADFLVFIITSKSHLKPRSWKGKHASDTSAPPKGFHRTGPTPAGLFFSCSPGPVHPSPSLV